ncbi:MAG: response regulator [Gammaproteobacteria bacterium]|nr:response regulator transcription factor [Rhodocyclaceae bacterium]MBU3908615.1 response regulator [Gammaproteobacteria bacterium]MBU3990438.1 response regulator [Gammaproteobacteria bacterium]MBU4004643.1 response regulator [Gammaproteobacteria bacterium]MBU4021246.1 response regulator [Gammaproteobacteria bacterium]
MNAQARIFVVDDDPAVRESLSLLLEQEDFQVETYDSAAAFLAACPPGPHSCAIVDIRMPVMDGMQLQAELTRRGIPLPVIFLTGHGDIPLSVRAIKLGAFDFLTKPVSGATLLESVRMALLESDRLNLIAASNQSAVERIASLTEREREVMALAVAGLSNKETAKRLGISHRTVEIHRARVMHKTGAESLVDLVRIAKAGATQE